MAIDVLSTGLHGLNVVLVLGLLYIYVQNYAKIKSKYTLGLMIFAVFFLIQSFTGLYFDATMVMYSSKEAETASMFLEGMKSLGFAILLWISWE